MSVLERLPRSFKEMVTNRSGSMGDTAARPRMPASDGTGLPRRRRDGRNRSRWPMLAKTDASRPGRTMAIVVIVLTAGLLAPVFGAGASSEGIRPAGKEGIAVTKLELTSTAFKEGETIPKKFTCVDANVSPPLRWSSPPARTKSLALLCEDPDAPVGLWVHWVLWGLPPDSTSLPEGVPPEKILSNKTRQGRNDFKKIGYGGPCPPPGKPHRYFFKLYALDSALNLEPGATRNDLLKAIEGHLIAQGELMGRFMR
jgi:Raf kinase inhibitor-like YbhB/YbcL family protein